MEELLWFDFAFTEGMYTFHNRVCLSRTGRSQSLTALSWVDLQERHHHFGTGQYWHWILALSGAIADIFGTASNMFHSRWPRSNRVCCMNISPRTTTPFVGILFHGLPARSSTEETGSQEEDSGSRPEGRIWDMQCSFLFHQRMHRNMS